MAQVGRINNAWGTDTTTEATGAGGTSRTLDADSRPFVTAMGNADAATTITLQVSPDGTTFYDTTITQVLAAAGNFAIQATVGARFVRLKSSAGVNATASIQAKGS